jgi:translation initiation factor 1
MDWKEQLNRLLPEDYQPENESSNEEATESKAVRQTLRVELDRRNGKPATIVSEFEGTDEALKNLAQTLRKACSAGGSQRDGEILIQGDFRQKVAEILQNMGYKVKKINFK